MVKIWSARMLTSRRIIFSLAFVLMLVIACRPCVVAFDWIPYVPPENTVELHHWISNGVSYIDVFITFPHTELSDFRLATNNEMVRRVQNYAIVVDPGWR